MTTSATSDVPAKLQFLASIGDQGCVEMKARKVRRFFPIVLLPPLVWYRINPEAFRDNLDPSNLLQIVLRSLK